jgi:mannose-6-phosphate isomerase-like protein (cupin superfamily)
MARSGEPTQEPTIIEPGAAAVFHFGGLGVDWKIDGPDTGGRFSIVHHPIAPRTLAAPLHYHHNEDEYSYVLKGRLGALLGDDVVETGPRHLGLQAPPPVAHLLECRR